MQAGDHMDTPTFAWTRGLQADLARTAGVSVGYLCELLHRRKRCTPDVAKRISSAALMLEIPLTRTDLLYPEESNSLAFRS